ncbi:hypothetical protein ACQKMD_01415 [Viridibacillus sp. NPDC096237]|uniref:hypothetical protein n=1 Tax=Viridibacillus sp. NPDC096237 TaxID=3390721 RepID=UPI003D048D8E
MVKVIDCTHIAKQVLKVLAENETPIFTVETILDIVRRTVRTQNVVYEIKEQEQKAISYTKPLEKNEVERYKKIIQEENETLFEKKMKELPTK